MNGEKKHLSDIDIASLISGCGSRALHHALAAHLAACGTCRELVARAVIANRDATNESEERDTAAEAAILEGMLEGLAKTARTRVAETGSRIRILLKALAFDADAEGLALAAQSPAAARLPTLTSDDSSIVVHFRRPQPDSALRAYVVRPLPQMPYNMWIVFPDTDRRFIIGSDGEADLPDVREDELAEGRVEIELRPAADS